MFPIASIPLQRSTSLPLMIPIHPTCPPNETSISSNLPSPRRRTRARVKHLRPPDTPRRVLTQQPTVGSLKWRVEENTYQSGSQEQGEGEGSEECGCGWLPASYQEEPTVVRSTGWSGVRGWKCPWWVGGGDDVVIAHGAVGWAWGLDGNGSRPCCGRIWSSVQYRTLATSWSLLLESRCQASWA